MAARYRVLGWIPRNWESCNAEMDCMEVVWVKLHPQSFWNKILMLTVTEINSSHPKMNGWNTRFLFGWAIFRAIC